MATKTLDQLRREYWIAVSGDTRSLVTIEDIKRRYLLQLLGY